MRTIYFDYNATTPLDPAVREAMAPFLGEHFGNPSSIHHVGRKTRAHLDSARERAASSLGCKPSEITFTSGGTESVNLAILGTARAKKSQGRHVITSTVEHHAVLHACDYLEREEGFKVTRLPVDTTGRVAVEQLEGALQPDTVLVSLMAANNETGALQPVAEAGAICRRHGVPLHTDAVQWFGKEPLENINQFNADLVSICGHKFHGPKGAGALFIKSPFKPHSLLLGGSHENEQRAGTENLAGIIGLVEAMERFLEPPVFEHQSLQKLTSKLIEAIDAIDGAKFVGSRDPGTRLKNTISFVVEGADSIVLLANLDLEGVCASSGAACSAGSLEPSHVVAAMGYPPDLAKSFVRFSLGRDSTADEVEEVCRLLPGIIRRSKASQ